MKKYLVSIALLTFIAACGGGTGTENKSDSSTTSSADNSAANDISENPDYKAGLKMIASSDCLTCHEPTVDKIGPAYQKIADKYAGADTALDYLAHKIITGSTPATNVWGMPGVMTPHATLSVDSAKQMAKYVLLLKTK